MSQLLFAAWIIAGAVLVLPLGLFLRLGRRLVGRGRALRRSAVPAALAFAPEEQAAFPYSGYAGAADFSLPVAVAPEQATARPIRGLRHRFAPMLSFLIYVAFIAGAIYYVPQILSWALDTPHPMAAVSSQSMWPTLKKGDLIFLEGVDKPDDLQVGDIIAFQHPKGITVHRILEIKGDIITTKGDGNPAEDKAIRFDQVVGRVLTVGGRLARVPWVGSIASLFGSLATRPDQTQEEQKLSAGEPSETLAGPGADLAAGEQTLPGGAVNASPGVMELASVDSAGNQADGPSTFPAISADGRFVAFASDASNLVAGDSNRQSDVFVHDRQTGATERVSVDSSGNQANGGSSEPAVSADGRYVAFVSAASNLVAGDSNSQSDVFVRDRQTGVTERASVDSDGSQGNGGSEAPAISGDGRFIAFVSAASNLVPGDSSGQSDVFVRDRQTGATERVSVDSAGNQANGSSDTPAISGDGRFIAFVSAASNLIPGDTKGHSDVFVHDRQTGTTERVSVGTGGGEGDGSSDGPAISADGRFVAFQSKARNLVPRDFNRDQDIFVRDRQTGTTQRVSVDSAGNQANNSTSAPAISGDGRFVAFQGGQSNLVPGDTNRFQDVFVHDHQTGATEQVSVDSAGYQGNDHSGLPAISGDGRFVAFWSYANNLVAGDGNVSQDVFVRGPND
ncbi:MAG: signal peptidase I [Dehalococcoidia bacterium]|nr:signal peptidase I [Dehalococcoidia bacterium]